MAYNSISIKSYIKSHLELQREITLLELAPSPYFLVLSICLAYMNMFARFYENHATTLPVIKETKHYGRTHRRTTWKQYTHHKQSLRGYENIQYDRGLNDCFTCNHIKFLGNDHNKPHSLMSDPTLLCTFITCLVIYQIKYFSNQNSFFLWNQ